MKNKKEQYLKNIKTLSSKFNKLQEELNKADDGMGGLGLHHGMAIAGIRHSIQNYTDKDWEEYEKETKNERVRIPSKPKTAIEAHIDEACCVKEFTDICFLNFAIWFCKNYLKGIKQ